MTTEPLVPAAAPPEPGFYILRVWHEPGAVPSAGLWRAFIMAGTGGERRCFASIDECIDHLYKEFSQR